MLCGKVGMKICFSILEWRSATSVDSGSILIGSHLDANWRMLFMKNDFELS